MMDKKEAMEVKAVTKINKIYKKLPLNIDEAKKIVDYILNSFMVIINDVCGNKSSCKDIDEVISLLQQGERDSEELKTVKEELKKVWQMWEAFKTINREYFSNFEIRANYIIRMKELEQKYFPKEENNG